VPQLRDTAELLAAASELPGLRPQVLVPTARRGRDAVAAGARFLVYVLSVSESHNRSNVRRSPAESAEDYARLLDGLPAGVEVRINLATAFDCPFEGRVPVGAAIDLIGRLVALRPDVEVCLCDTTGRATPDHVAQLSAASAASFPRVAAWAYHAHDTYGLGLATTYAAYQAGLRVFDAAAGGLGGCPFAPGATGNVATEDVVWAFERMGIATGVDLDALLPWLGTRRRCRAPLPAAGRGTRCSRRRPARRRGNRKGRGRASDGGGGTARDANAKEEGGA
jgi:hydroxymethylglutaryl-CoA lyase